MANYFVQMPGMRAPGPLNFEPVTNALMQLGQTRERQMQRDMQQRNALMEQQRWETTNARAEETHRNALADRAWQQPLERQKAEMGLQLTQAQIEKLKREPVGHEAPSNVREWEHFSKLPPDQQQQYLTMKRANQYLDLGDRYAQPDPMQPGGSPRHEVSKNLAEAERQKVTGREGGEGQMALPKTARALKMYELQSEIVGENIERAIALADGWTTGIPGAVASNVPGTAAHNLSKTLDTVKANLGFDKLQNMRENSPTGGALGQVAVQELTMLQAVWGSVEQSQSKEQLVANLNKIKQVQAQFRTLRQQAYEQDVQRFGASAVANPETGAMPGATAPAAPAAEGSGGWSIKRVK